jgi:hypothetical protein
MRTYILNAQDTNGYNISILTFQSHGACMCYLLHHTTAMNSVHRVHLYISHGFHNKRMIFSLNSINWMVSVVGK